MLNNVLAGASVDPAGVTMLDSVKVYVKTKESFGWPEDSEEFLDSASATSTKVQTETTPTTSLVTGEMDTSSVMALPLTSMDR